MATLVLNDGTRKEVPHNQAAEIRQVLDGEKEPENEEQEEFLLKVAAVEFPRPNSIKATVVVNDEDRAKRRKAHKAIMANKKLTGKQKFVKIKDLYKKP